MSRPVVVDPRGSNGPGSTNALTGLVARIRRDPIQTAIALVLVAGVGLHLGAGMSLDSVATLGGVALFIGYPAVVVLGGWLATRRRPPVLEIGLVVVLLWIGWLAVESVVRGPQPGDVICVDRDPRSGDCTREEVYRPDLVDRP